MELSVYETLAFLFSSIDQRFSERRDRSWRISELEAVTHSILSFSFGLQRALII